MQMVEVARIELGPLFIEGNADGIALEYAITIITTPAVWKSASGPPRSACPRIVRRRSKRATPMSSTRQVTTVCSPSEFTREYPLRHRLRNRPVAGALQKGLEFCVSANPSSLDGAPIRHRLVCEAELGYA
jgi:hypothetical protein